MPDKQRVLELVTAMLEGYSYQEIVQALNAYVVQAVDELVKHEGKA